MPPQTPKKIFVDKNETAADLVNRILAAREKDIVVVVPKDASFKTSLKNFHLLKQESAAAEKNILIESVDDEVLAFAKASAIEANHPLFRESGNRLSDIVPRGRRAKKENAAMDEEEKAAKEASVLPDALHVKAKEQFFSDASPEEAPQRYRSRRRISRRSLTVIAVVAICAVGAFFIFNHYAKATIAIHFITHPFDYEGTITVTPQATAIAADKDQIPGELFTSQKNFTQLFPATGKTDVSTKAQGTVTIWNAYSSAAQTLVATTRFETPDGKVFRLDKTTVVPGAHVANGKITPSSIDAAVTADLAGPDGNVGAIQKLTIPGFKGTARYDGFYGEFKTGTSGGASGAHAVATADDIAQAKTKAQSILNSSLETLVLASIPDGFTIMSSTEDVSVSKIAVNSNTDSNGNFSVFAEATLRAIGYRKGDLKSLLLAHANQDAQYQEDFADIAMDVSSTTADYANSSMTFHIKATGNVMPAFVPSTFISNVAGKSESEARTAVLALPGLLDAKIYLWPIWETRLPADQNRITIQMN